MTTNQTTERAAGHTPGPWIADGYNVRQPAGRYVAYTGPSHTPADKYPDECARQDLANARLIASAPDLLAALESMVRMCDGESGMGAGYWETVREYCEAKRAIANAKGGAT